MTRPAVGLLDTSVVIHLEGIDEAGTLPRQPLVSAITLAELSVGPLVAPPEQRPARLRHIQTIESGVDPLPFDSRAARAFGHVAASMRHLGRKTSARTYDAMIAAIAPANELPLYTCNPRDFEGIDGLEVIAVPVPGR